MNPGATAPCHSSQDASSPLDGLLYLYAIAEAGGGLAERLAAAPVAGLGADEPLFSLEAGELAAVVSRVQAAVFQEEPLNALLSDLPRLAPYVVGHEDAVRALTALSPALIPIHFGAVYRGAAQITALLTERSEELRAILARLRGREEWGLKLFVDAERLIAAADATEELRPLADEAAGAGPGRAYLLGRQRQRLVAAAARRLLDEAVDRILTELGALSVAVRREELAGKDGGGPRLTFKAAFLIERGVADDFCSTAYRLRRGCVELGGALELSGPWAAYSFVAGSSPGQPDG